MEAEFRPGDKVAVHGEIAEISGMTAIIRSGDGLVAADLGQLEHVTPETEVTPPKAAQMAEFAEIIHGTPAQPPVTETQLSFVVTKHWARPEGEAGWTEMTCSKGSFRRVLEWMLEELPGDTFTAGRGYAPGLAARASLLAIDWDNVPGGIRAPVIPPYLPPVDENAAAVARVRERLEKVVPLIDGSSGMINARQILDLLDSAGMWSYSFTAPEHDQHEAGYQVPERPEP
jgi:hypothetical protein